MSKQHLSAPRVTPLEGVTTTPLDPSGAPKPWLSEFTPTTPEPGCGGPRTTPIDQHGIATGPSTCAAPLPTCATAARTRALGPDGQPTGPYSCEFPPAQAGNDAMLSALQDTGMLSDEPDYDSGEFVSSPHGDPSTLEVAAQSLVKANDVAGMTYGTPSAFVSARGATPSSPKVGAGLPGSTALAGVSTAAGVAQFTMAANDQAERGWQEDNVLGMISGGNNVFGGMMGLGAHLLGSPWMAWNAGASAAAGFGLGWGMAGDAYGAEAGHADALFGALGHERSQGNSDRSYSGWAADLGQRTRQECMESGGSFCDARGALSTLGYSIVGAGGAAVSGVAAAANGVKNAVALGLDPSNDQWLDTWDQEGKTNELKGAYVPDPDYPVVHTGSR